MSWDLIVPRVYIVAYEDGGRMRKTLDRLDGFDVVMPMNYVRRAWQLCEIVDNADSIRGELSGYSPQGRTVNQGLMTPLFQCSRQIGDDYFSSCSAREANVGEKYDHIHMVREPCWQLGWLKDAAVESCSNALAVSTGCFSGDRVRWCARHDSNMRPSGS